MGDKKGLSELVNSFFNLLMSTFIVLAVIQIYFAKPILNVLLPGFSGTKLETTIFFFQIQAVLSVFTISTALMVALNYTMKKYYRTVTIPLLGIFVQMAVVYVTFENHGINSLIFGLAADQILIFALYAIPFIRFYRPKIVFNTPLKDTIRKIYPLMISSAFSKSNMLVDRFFLSSLSSGSITLLHYGEKIIAMISSFLNRGVSIVTLRSLSLNSDNENNFQKQFYQIYKTMIFIVIPVSIMVVIFLKDALGLIVVTGKITQSNIKNIYLVTIALIGILVGGTLNGPLTNAFYAKGLTVIISRTNIVLQIFGISLKITLFLIVGFWGLPIAFSITSLSLVFVLLILYNINIQRLNFNLVLNYTFIITALSAISAVIPILIMAKYDAPLINITFLPILFISTYFILSVKIEKDISNYILSKAKLNF